MEQGLVVDAVRSPWESELDQKVIGGAIVTNRRTPYGKDWVHGPFERFESARSGADNNDKGGASCVNL